MSENKIKTAAQKTSPEWNYTDKGIHFENLNQFRNIAQK